jgi:hypothetical protein
MSQNRTMIRKTIRGVEFMVELRPSDPERNIERLCEYFVDRCSVSAAEYALLLRTAEADAVDAIADEVKNGVFANNIQCIAEALAVDGEIAFGDALLKVLRRGLLP